MYTLRTLLTEFSRGGKRDEQSEGIGFRVWA